MHLRLYFFAHVVVLVLDIDSDAIGILRIDFAGKVFHLFFASFEAVAVVVTNDVGKSGFFDCSRHRGEMIEAFIAFGVLGCFTAGEHRSELVCHTHRVDHLVFGIARVDVAAAERDLSDCCIEVFKLKFADFSSVHRVAPIGGESLDVEFVGTEADFLVRIEGDADVAVRDFIVLKEKVDGGDNFSDTGLVVGTEEGVTVGDDKVLTYVVEHFGEFSGVKANAFVVEWNHFAVVLLDDAGSNVFARHIGRRVKVGDKTDGGHFAVDVRRERRHQISVFVE